MRSPSWEWLSGWTIRWKGYAETYWVLTVCMFAVLGFASVPLKHWLEPAETITAHWWYLPHVSELMPDNEYIVLHMDRKDALYGTESRYAFCAKGGKIDFDEGEMIQDIEYREHGDCKELMHYNYEKVENNRGLVKHYKTNAEVIR